ncbi:MAG: hypothetical protein II163_06405 [Ruminococcus sp.]|nr:hypothetical protein [Ruminococcus sp.]
MDVKIRKLESNLTTIGTGVIAFGFWGFLKFILSYLFLGAQSVGIDGDEYITVIAVFVWAVAILIPLVYLWIGMSARAEGRGKRKSALYLLMVGWIIFVSTIAILLELYSLSKLKDWFEIIVTLIIDLTRYVFLIELMVYSISLRKLRKEQNRGEESKA